MRNRGLRVIAGEARGRRLVTPAGGAIRPTKDVVREAMFSALDARHLLVDAKVLDLFAGSGALAIEALSRGAARAVLVEIDRHALHAIRANVEAVGYAPRARVVTSAASTFLAGAVPLEAPFDLVFLDPPYETPDDRVTELVAAVCRPDWLAADGVVAVERPFRRPVVAPPGCRSGWERRFGDTLLTFCWR